MSWGGFLFFNAICDAVSNVAKNSRSPRRGTSAYNRAVIGSIVAIILWIAVIALFIASL